eukprot:s2029_g10.t1
MKSGSAHGEEEREEEKEEEEKKDPGQLANEKTTSSEVNNTDLYGSDEEIFDPGLHRVRLVLLSEFCPAREGDIMTMISAFATNDVFTLEMLLKRPLNPNVVYQQDGCTPLLHVAEAGDLDPVLVLLEAGADKDAASPDGITLLITAGQMGYLEIVRVLVDAGAAIGVALGDICLRFVWQAWHLETWTFTLCGRRGTYGTGLALVAALVALGPVICLRFVKRLVFTMLGCLVVLPVVMMVVVSIVLCREANKIRSSFKETKQQGALVISPYAPLPEPSPQVTSFLVQLIRLMRICVPTICCEQAFWLCAAFLLSGFYGLLACLEPASGLRTHRHMDVPSVLVRPLWTMVKVNLPAAFQDFVAIMLGYNAAIAILKAAMNFCGMRAMISFRRANLDHRVDTPDARITNDTDLLLQFLFEFVFGGIMKPESGACCQIFFLIFTVAVAYQEAEDGAPGWGWPSIGIAFMVVVVSLVPTLAAADGLTKAQSQVQSAEASLRSAYSKCSLFAESICFYGGEESEAERLEKLYVRVRLGFQSFAMYKLLVDLSQLAFYFGLAPISMAIAAFVVRKGSWTQDSETTFYAPWRKGSWARACVRCAHVLRC